MEIIEAVKTLYENNSDKVIYTDSYLKVLWKIVMTYQNFSAPTK